MRKWRIIIAIGVAAVIGLLLTLTLREGVPSHTLLEVRLDRPFVEHRPSSPLSRMLQRGAPVLRDLVDALDKAAKDDRVVGLVATVGNAPMGIATAQEIRGAIARFRARKKFAIAFAETFGEFGPANVSYYLATAFDEVHLQPSGDVGLMGLYLQVPFLKGTLEKLGVRVRGDQRYEYKNALNTFTQTKFTPAHREAMEALKRSLFGQLVRGIAMGRRIAEETVRGLVDRGPLLASEAHQAKLVDRLSYRDEAYAVAKKKAGEGAKLLYWQKYLERAGRPHASGKTIALVYGVGTVSRGSSEVAPWSGSMVLGSRTVAKALRDAVKDNSVKAIVFRIDSPGGSYVASDTIWRETVRAREAGKPVVVSMGNLAASGGYFVAMSADKIVAHPGTITGSIGVLAGKPVMTGLFEKIGLTFDHVQAGANAGLFSTGRDFSPAEWARLQSWLDRIYADFTTKVAKGRKLPVEKVQKIARGRVWTGEDAKRLGLVDELGGLDTALRLAKKAASIADDESVRVRVFPEPKRSPIEEYLRFVRPDTPDSSEDPAAVALVRRALRLLQPVVRRLGLVSTQAGDHVLSAPPLFLRDGAPVTRAP